MNSNGKGKGEKLEVKRDPRSPIIDSVALGRVVMEALGLEDVPIKRLVIDMDPMEPHPIFIAIEAVGTEDLLKVPWDQLLKGVKAHKEPA